MSKITDHISKLRDEFMQGTLSENDVNVDPFVQFETWFHQAIEANLPEAQAMTLSTCVDNKPSARIVYLREIKNHRFWFYGNYNSRKSRELTQNPNASLSFYWPALERQIRIEGTAEKAEKSTNDNYFENRPYESKLGAWASPQSSKISSRSELEDKMDALKLEFLNKDIPRPEFWGGWVLNARYYEFWQGRQSRLHDRICYELKNNNWEINRLAP